MPADVPADWNTKGRKNTDVTKSEEVDVLKKVVKTMGKRGIMKMVKAQQVEILKEEFREVGDLKGEILKSIVQGDTIKVQEQYTMTSVMLENLQMKILTKVLEHEDNKKKMKPATLKWAFEAVSEMRKAGSETRKANEGKHKMVHGEKHTNINVNAKMSLEEFNNMKPKNLLEGGDVIDCETVQVEPGKKDSTGDKTGN